MTVVLGLDIGGANLKAATSDGRSQVLPFPLWRQPEQLSLRLDDLVAQFADCERVAVTMTGELADCYATKGEGVRQITAAVVEAAGPRLVGIWSTAGRFLASQEARQQPALVAAANWHALATWAGQFAPRGPALLIDIGTTTADIIPLRDGAPCATGRTDPERLRSRELLYTGVSRTPLCAVARELPWRDSSVTVAAELFATMRDVYLLLGDLPEEADDFETANGRPATVAAAHDRMVRMLCADRDEIPHVEGVLLARHFAAEQQRQIVAAVRQVLDRQSLVPQTVIVSGSGEFLAERVVAACVELSTAKRVSLSRQFSPQLASTACAYAVAQLAGSSPWPDKR
jgi:(4-(4-[2-(gamma-L-glutamylamino)ethyl]phenoxymethyl)furan-2-yl)methanamine synthase